MMLKNTLEPVVTVQDVMDKWGLKDKRTAKKYMLNIPHLKAYYNLSGELVCERQFFDEMMEELLRVGNMEPLMSMSMMLPGSLLFDSDDEDDSNWAKDQLRKAGMSEQQLRRIIQLNRERR